MNKVINSNKDNYDPTMAYIGLGVCLNGIILLIISFLLEE